MKATQNLTTINGLGTIQPVSHLQNYNKYIVPLLATGHTVYLTKGGSNYCKISPDSNSQMLNINKYIRTLAGKIVEKHLNALNKHHTYTTKQAEQMIDDEL